MGEFPAVSSVGGGRVLGSVPLAASGRKTLRLPSGGRLCPLGGIAGKYDESSLKVSGLTSTNTHHRLWSSAGGQTSRKCILHILRTRYFMYESMSNFTSWMNIWTISILRDLGILTADGARSSKRRLQRAEGSLSKRSKRGKPLDKRRDKLTRFLNGWQRPSHSQNLELV